LRKAQFKVGLCPTEFDEKIYSFVVNPAATSTIAFLVLFTTSGVSAVSLTVVEPYKSMLLGHLPLQYSLQVTCKVFGRIWNTRSWAEIQGLFEIGLQSINIFFR